MDWQINKVTAKMRNMISLKHKTCEIYSEL